jgi:Kef-type K+ transport system membrane component KefB
VVVVVAAVVKDIAAVVFVAAFEVVEAEVSVVAVPTVVSVVAVFVAVVLILPTLKTKGLEPGRQDHQISNIISSSSVYLFSYLFIAP